jgi:hypothetical protein
MASRVGTLATGVDYDKGILSRLDLAACAAVVEDFGEALGYTQI